MDRQEKLRTLMAPTAGLIAIIVMSLASGVGAYVAFVASQNGLPDFANIAKAPLSPMVMAGIGLALSGIVMGAAIPKIVTKVSLPKIEAKQSLDDQAAQLGELYKLNTILAGALFEGPAFLGAIGYHLEGSAIGFSIALFLVLAIATLFPTPGRMASWADLVLRQVEERSSMNKEDF